MTPTKELLKKFSRKFINAFLQGLLLIAPISITVFVIYTLLEWVDGLLPISIPGLGLLIIVGSIAFIGFAGSAVIKKPLAFVFHKIIERIPLVKILYTSISDLLSAFVGQKKKFTEPVMVIMNK